MNPENGGQDFNVSKQTSDLQRQAASAIARKKVLAAYAKKAADAAREAKKADSAENSAHYKNEPIAPKINSESWKKYHSAWQDYYQKYYSEYYSKAARTYIEKERLKDAREKAEEEEILMSLTKASKKSDKKSGFKLEKNGVIASASEIAVNEGGFGDNLKYRIRKKATESAKKSRRSRGLFRFWQEFSLLF